MSGYRTVSDGLMMVFIGQILAIFTFLPVVGGILAIASVIVQLAGLYYIRPDVKKRATEWPSYCLFS